MEKETKTIRKITLTFDNDLEYLLFIKNLAYYQNINANLSVDAKRIKNIAEYLFNREFADIAEDEKLNKLYESLYQVNL